MVLRESDSTWQKCPGYISSILPICLNLSALTQYSDNCYSHLKNGSGVSNVQYGAGFICYVLYLVLSNVPALIINFIIPVPDHEDCCDEVTPALAAVWSLVCIEE